MPLKSIIESILFAVGEPINIGKLADTLNENRNSIKTAIAELRKEYESNKGGLRIIHKENDFQLVSAPENSRYIEKIIKDDLQEDLTPASVETLAIIAYRGPITRVDIDEIRGVNSSFILRNLLIRGLISRKGHPEDNRSYIYEISFDFLKKLGISSVEKLPDYENLTNKEK